MGETTPNGASTAAASTESVATVDPSGEYRFETGQA
jgi:hypothetical protein